MKKHLMFGALMIAAVTAPHAAFADLSKRSQNFVANAAVGNQFEISSSQLALQDSQDPTIRQFAQQMIDDHKQIGDQMGAALRAPDVGMMPPDNALDKKHQHMLDVLAKKSGANFDKKYVSEQVDAHKEAVGLFKKYASRGDNDTLKGFAAQNLPMIQEHLAQIKQIRAGD